MTTLVLEPLSSGLSIIDSTNLWFKIKIASSSSARNENDDHHDSHSQVLTAGCNRLEFLRPSWAVCPSQGLSLGLICYMDYRREKGKLYLLIFSFIKTTIINIRSNILIRTAAFTPVSHLPSSPSAREFFSFLVLAIPQTTSFSLQGQPLEGIRGMTSGLSRAVAGLKPPRHSSVTDSGQATVLCLHHFRSSLWNRGMLLPWGIHFCPTSFLVWAGPVS